MKDVRDDLREWQKRSVIDMLALLKNKDKGKSCGFLYESTKYRKNYFCIFTWKIFYISEIFTLKDVCQYISTSSCYPFFVSIEPLTQKFSDACLDVGSVVCLACNDFFNVNLSQNCYISRIFKHNSHKPIWFDFEKLDNWDS